jgi:hypothetical protein
MNKEFVPYEIALDLKELGFDEPCLATHGYLNLYIGTQDGHIDVPLYQQAFRWFRDKYELEYSLRGRKSMGYDFVIDGIKIPTGGRDSKYSNFVYPTYEQAELACLIKLIEIVKNK